MSVAMWPELFEKVLRAHLPWLLVSQPLTQEVSLTDQGLDSLATVSLLLELETEFEVSFPDDLLVAETFATAGSLWTVVEALRRR